MDFTREFEMEIIMQCVCDCGCRTLVGIGVIICSICKNKGHLEGR